LGHLGRIRELLRRLHQLLLLKWLLQRRLLLLRRQRLGLELWLGWQRGLWLQCSEL
jgi:hypothetical protein